VGGGAGAAVVGGGGGGGSWAPQATMPKDKAPMAASARQPLKVLLIPISFSIQLVALREPQVP
jgi:hypothetical protein